jgi:YesN/AraC family two-component response regulator
MSTVLIVDDEIDMRTIVRIVLQSASQGITVVAEAVDGVEALTVFENLKHPEVPDVVILDNRMPGRMGIEVAQEIRRIEPDQAIILYSAFLTPDLEDQARAVGVARCVSKADYDTLPDIVTEIAAGARRRGSGRDD